MNKAVNDLAKAFGVIGQTATTAVSNFNQYITNANLTVSPYYGIGNSSVTTAGTAPYQTVSITPNPVYGQTWRIVGDPKDLTLTSCPHASWNDKTRSCDDCHVTADAIAKAQIWHRRPAPLEFNRYINASDLMEEFIKFLGEQNVKQADILNMPVELFVKWLIIQACEQDQEEPNVTLQLPAPKTQPRCKGCQKFLKRGLEVPFHSNKCSQYYFRRVAA